MPKPPVAPKENASKAEHKKHAQDVLDYEPYKHEPPGGVPRPDDVSEHIKGEHHEPQ